MTVVVPTSLRQIQGGEFPLDALKDCKTALILFAAGFYGRNDAVWLARQGIQSTCVDLDHEKLDAMADVYPDNWEFVVDDIFKYVSKSKHRRFDVVTADPWTNQFQLAADITQGLCRLAKKSVILGTGAQTIIAPPDGWKITRKVDRSNSKTGEVFWAVLKPE